MANSPQLETNQEFQRLKEAEQQLLGWSAKRELAKTNYHIHMDAIRQYILDLLFFMITKIKRA